MESDNLNGNERELVRIMQGASETEMAFIKSLLTLFIHAQALKAGTLKIKGKDIDIDLSTN
ncbi:MAG: hypothetical protein BWY80_01255 [Firmicutes bacterium ADurb.Bin456]|nr:MAG: hypothetical protein BWY80_01255 [Firmicutes bacterium ADurb.Bin456]